MSRRMNWRKAALVGRPTMDRNDEGSQGLRQWGDRILEKGDRRKAAQQKFASRPPSGHGPPCPRCRQPTKIRRHKRITPEMLERPFYYSQWYFCANRACKTQMIMPPEFRVFRCDPVPETKVEDVDIALAVLDRKVLYDGESPPWE